MKNKRKLESYDDLAMTLSETEPTVLSRGNVYSERFFVCNPEIEVEIEAVEKRKAESGESARYLTLRISNSIFEKTS